MRLQAACLTLVLLSATAFAAPTALVGGRIIDGWGGTPIDGGVVLIDGQRIVAVGAANAVAIPADARVISIRGMSVLPGLWESNGHLMHAAEGNPERFPADFASKSQLVTDAVARVSLLAGITSFRDVGGEYFDEKVALKKRIDAGESPGPRLYLSAHGLTQLQYNPEAAAARKAGKPQPFVVTSLQDARTITQRLIDLGAAQISIDGHWDAPILKEIVATARSAGLGVDADSRHIETTRLAIECGVDRIHHVFVADALTPYSDDDLRLLVRGVGPSIRRTQGPYIVPTFEMRKSFVTAREFPGAVDHPRFAAQYPPEVFESLQENWPKAFVLPQAVDAAERTARALQRTRAFIDAGGRTQLVAGSYAGSPLNFHGAVAREVRDLHAAGLTTMEAIQSATLRPAQMQGVLKDVGTISAGKLADLIVVDGNPLTDLSLIEHKLKWVIKDGKVFDAPR